MQSNPRLSANLLVILVEILVNLLVKPTKLRLGGGPWGGAYPLYAKPLPGRILAPIPGVHQETYETCETYWRPRREIKRLPLYDFLFPDFLVRRF